MMSLFRCCHLLCNLNVYGTQETDPGAELQNIYIEKSWNHGICRSSFVVKETSNKSKMRVLMLLVVSLPYIYTEYS